jgi:serpin B
MVDVLTRMILVNAIYLKAPWTIPFEPAATQSAPFTLLDGSTAQVPFMSRSDESMAYARGGGWQAVELPYAGDKLAMLVLVPDEGAMAAVEDELTRGLLDRAAGALAPTNVVLQLPKWDVETRVELSQALSALGMPTAFTDDADFTGMTTDEPLHISFVVHQANITVDEAGTEAAAATAVGIATTAAPAEEPIAVTVDRPFVYALRDLGGRRVPLPGTRHPPDRLAQEWCASPRRQGAARVTYCRRRPPRRSSRRPPRPSSRRSPCAPPRSPSCPRQCSWRDPSARSS